MTAEFAFSAQLWEWAGKASWYFVSLPEAIADEIEERFGGTAGGFGSVRVEVTIGATTWRTSLFPSSAERTYVLPVKKAVRTAEDLDDGSTAAVTIRVVQD